MYIQYLLAHTRSQDPDHQARDVPAKPEARREDIADPQLAGNVRDVVQVAGRVGVLVDRRAVATRAEDAGEPRWEFSRGHSAEAFQDASHEQGQVTDDPARRQPHLIADVEAAVRDSVHETVYGESDLLEALSELLRTNRPGDFRLHGPLQSVRHLGVIHEKEASDDMLARHGSSPRRESLAAEEPVYASIRA
jgi:hypothetical protein